MRRLKSYLVLPVSEWDAGFPNAPVFSSTHPRRARTHPTILLLVDGLLFFPMHNNPPIQSRSAEWHKWQQCTARTDPINLMIYNKSDDDLLYCTVDVNLITRII